MAVERFVCINYHSDGWVVGVAEGRPAAVRLFESRMKPGTRMSLRGRDEFRRFLEGEDRTPNAWAQESGVIDGQWHPQSHGTILRVDD